MKRYVRTEGQIFDTEYEPKAFKWNWNAKFIIDDNNLIVYDTVFKDRIANHGQILKQADTIEELCDEFVLIKRGKPELFVRNNDEIAKHCAFESFVKFNLPHSNKITDIYGAIWCDFGLKYVARVNNEGKLELI